MNDAPDILMPLQVVSGLDPILGGGGASDAPRRFSGAAHSTFKLGPPKSVTFPNLHSALERKR